MVAERLKKLGVEADLRIIKTSGDVFLDKPLHMISGWGVFVAEIDDRLLSGEIDLAVHSMKDMPSKRPAELGISAILRRDSPYDILASRDGCRLEDLGKGAAVGTSSMRRSAQLKRARPDLEIKSLRGNLQTRLRKLAQGDYDAIVLAEAGLQRMGYRMEYCRLDPESFVPSANQGTIAVIARKGSWAEECSRPLDHETTRAETMIERIILETVGGGCVVPMAVHARVQGDAAEVTAEVLSLDGQRFVRLEETVPLQEGHSSKEDYSSKEGLSLLEGYLKRAEKLGERLMEMGGRELVAEAVRAFGR